MNLERLMERYRDIMTMTLFRGVELAVTAKYLRYLNGRTVDIACGDGSVASLTFGNQMPELGYDIEVQSVRAASRCGYRNVVVADARYNPFRDAQFEGLFSNSSIEHFPEVDKCFDEFRRISKPGSFFVFTVMSGSFYDSFWCTRIGLRGAWTERHRRLRQHLNLWHVDQWRDFLEHHGFELVEHQYYFNPRTTFWWSLLEDAYTWPFNLGLLLTLPAKFVPQKVVRRLVEGLIAKDEQLCAEFGEGSGLLLVARRKI